MLGFGGLANSGNREKYTIKEYLTYGGLTFLFFGMLVLYAFELEYFSRYLKVSNLVISSLVIGLLIGIGAGFYFKNKAKNATETVQIYVFFIVLSLIFSPLIFSLINRSISLEKDKKEVQIVKVDKRFSSRFGSNKGEKPQANLLVITYLYKGKSYSFSTRQLNLENSKRGDLVQVDFKKGLLGFEYILPQ